MKLLSLFLCLAPLLLLGQPQIEILPTGTQHSLRGISAVSKSICWLSGSEGSALRTTDGGLHWEDRSPTGYETLDFRDVEALSADTAYLLSAGSPGVLLYTTDGGRSWLEVFRNDDPAIFYDALALFPDGSGVFFGDALGENLPLVLGRADQWQNLSEQYWPQVLAGQGGFAASGSCLQTFGDSGVAIVLGGADARFLYSADRGKSWRQSELPLDQGEASKGAFSLWIASDSMWYAAGGDYRADSLSSNSLAISQDQGRSWQLWSHHSIHGHYLSSIIQLPNNGLLSCSRFGCYYKAPAENMWQSLSGPGFYSLDQAPDGSVWASGAKGKAGFIRLSDY